MLSSATTRTEAHAAVPLPRKSSNMASQAPSTVVSKQTVRTARTHVAPTLTSSSLVRISSDQLNVLISTCNLDSRSDSCSICGDALALPCPKCSTGLGSAQCPLVQNSGCHHLHHAHCLGARRARGGGCPSGCPVAKFPREATVFGHSEPHLVVVWNGDQIENISLPFSMNGVSRDALVTMTTDAVIALVEKFLEQQSFARSGLSLRIHSRDPVAETVIFTQSTLVSVCPASLHPRLDHRRFPLFATKVPKDDKRPTRSPLAIDFFTSRGPIVACGCTLLGDLFHAPEGAENSVLLYAVKRRIEVAETPSDKRSIVSKQSMYLADAAWHPSVPQTPRGMAALLSSLYLLAHSVGQTGVAGEQKVLALVYTLFRFPPAVRTLAALFLNKAPRPEEKAALAEALYHALGEFSSRGPSAIVTRDTRRFETVRILLAYIASAAGATSAAQPQRPVDEVLLVCPLSQKRLVDPVMFNAAIVERTVARLYAGGGPLFHCAKTLGDATELTDKQPVCKLLAHSRGIRTESTLMLRVGDIGAPPASFMATLDAAARDFIQAIRRANQTDLVTRGPLELKSTDVVPPQIVLDQDAFLAIFTGRGCGTARDVNFFRPASGGDTEVDVNDVSYALEKVTITRKLEDTWQVDSFGEVSAISRPPDEAIVLCLDLSQSMNERSGVSESGNHPHREAFDVELESEKLVDKLTGHLTRHEIMNHAKAHLRAQHASCHYPWRTMLNPESDDSDGEDEDEDEADNLLTHLAKIASREALRLSLKAEGPSEDTDDEDCDEDIYGDPVETMPRVATSGPMLQLICFVAAVANSDMNDELVYFLNNIVDDSNSGVVGVEPFDVPRALLDLRSPGQTSYRTSRGAPRPKASLLLFAIHSEPTRGLCFLRLRPNYCMRW
ncbi:hypothetical protein B0H16DRAFT_514129 [Mycena metata]|uniref:Uncharacterized protein n=1 Tax=Mycena metata TaxID=1033252 RepID=A0AAD7MFH3_9AGAR|nr:hypothetical protein B0H16DRAFT_514129 [Mycena metata]